jgi:hypothetical protein
MQRRDVVALLASVRDDPQPLLERLAWIDTKQLPGQPARTRLVFNRAQRAVHAALQAQAARGMPKRGIVLKARQPGISTQACGYCAATALRPHAGALIVSHREDLSAALHRKTKSILDNFAPTLPVKFGVSRRDELVLDAIRCDDGDLVLRSAINCVTAGVGSAEGGRGITLQWVHLSEYAAFPNAEATLVATLQGVPPTPQSGVVIESTARGMGNSFHHEWLRAEEGSSGFTPVFIGWPMIEEYQLPLPHDGDETLTPDEAEMARAHGLSRQQVWWRRYVIATQCAGQDEFFNQEYPITAAEAFIVSGIPAFPRAVLTRMHEAMVGKPRWEGEWSTATHVPTPLRGGRLRIYVHPVPGHEYTLGADPSGGQEGGDPAAALVFDRQTGEAVAVWHGHLPPIPFAQVLDGLGRYYNEAILAPELNSGHGFSVIEELKSRQYPRLYVWQRVDKVTHSITNFYGWSTSYRTRPLLIDNLRHGLAEQEILVRDPATILELLEFQYADFGGRAEGLSHDDLAVACMIAFRVHVEYPMAATGLPPRHQAEDFTHDAEVVTYPNTYTKDAWEGVDKDMQRLQHGRGATWSDFAVGQPDGSSGLADEEWQHGLDQEPEVPW